MGRVLGEGGFGITYMGAHRQLQRTVAIKELFPEWAVRRGTFVSVPKRRQREFQMEVEQAREEALTIARIDSMNIVYVHDVFLENGTVYIVMEYLEGHTLQDRIEESGPLSKEAVRGIAADVCDALDAVHREGLLHRDIKPANIMLTSDGLAVLVDFGSARVFDHGRTVRHTRNLTMDYAAPEMFSSHARFGPYTDIFCLGGTLYHALTGVLPPAVGDRFLQDDRGALEFPDSVRGPLRDAIRQALQVRVENRPQSAAAFKATCLRHRVLRNRVDRYPRHSEHTGSGTVAVTKSGTVIVTATDDVLADLVEEILETIDACMENVALRMMLEPSDEDEDLDLLIAEMTASVIETVTWTVKESEKGIQDVVAELLESIDLTEIALRKLCTWSW